jgi:hypothetical protein
MRTLAAGARKSPATVCRWLKQLFEAGCFTRTREAGRVYRYTLAEPYRLRWRERPGQGVSSGQEGVSQPGKQSVSHGATQEADPPKDEEGAREEMKWRARLRRFAEHGLWVARHGPPPGDSACQVPPHLLAQWLSAQRRPFAPLVT